MQHIHRPRKDINRQDPCEQTHDRPQAHHRDQQPAEGGLIVLLFLFLGHKPLRKFTPLLFPFLYALMVYIEAPISGTSTNPARSLGPEVITWQFRAWWVYWVGPILGMLLGLSIHKYTWLKRLELEVAKLYHFEHDPYQVFGGQKSLDEKSGIGVPPESPQAAQNPHDVVPGQ